MTQLYSIYFFEIDMALSNYFAKGYDIFMYYFLVIFGNCPIFYQTVYGYAPLTYIWIRRKFRKNNYNNYFDKSNFNWIFFNIKLIFFRATKLIILYNYIEIFFKKIHYYMLDLWFSNYKYKFFYLKFLLKKIPLKNIWKPTFKKYSYFGIFAFLRSKWFK